MRFRRWIHILLALGAGLLLGAAFLDLLPEAVVIGIALGLPIDRIFTITLMSFLAFFAIENVLDSFSTGTGARVPRRSIGRIAGGMLVFHSFRDGMAIGAAFTASHTAGYAVAAGIAAHDLGDGMNTVLLTTGGEKPKLLDYGFLVADALAPRRRRVCCRALVFEHEQFSGVAGDRGRVLYPNGRQRFPSKNPSVRCPAKRSVRECVGRCGFDLRGQLPAEQFALGTASGALRDCAKRYLQAAQVPDRKNSCAVARNPFGRRAFTSIAQPSSSYTLSHALQWKWWWCFLPATSYRAGIPGNATPTSHSSCTIEAMLR